MRAAVSSASVEGLAGLYELLRGRAGCLQARQSALGAGQRLPGRVDLLFEGKGGLVEALGTLFFDGREPQFGLGARVFGAPARLLLGAALERGGVAFAAQVVEERVDLGLLGRERRLCFGQDRLGQAEARGDGKGVAAAGHADR